MENQKSIQPIVIPERVNTNQNDKEDNKTRGGIVRIQPLVIKDEENLMTAITHLDIANKLTINEESINEYSTLTKRVFQQLNKTEEHDRLDYNDFKTALIFLNVIVLESRTISLFHATAIDTQQLSRTDFEIALMINDSYPVHTSFLSFYELFASFDLDECGLLNFEQFKECVNTISFEEESDPKDISYLAYLFQKMIPKGKRMDYITFTKVWCSKLADVKRVLSRRGLLKGGSIGSTHKHKHTHTGKNRRRRITSMFSTVWKHFQLKDILQQEMIKPGHDIITQFETVRQQIVDLRREVQRVKDIQKRSFKDSSRKQKRKGVISASQRKKEMSLILRSEVEKTEIMMEENRMMRDKLQNDFEAENQNIELTNRRHRNDKIVREMEEIRRTAADRLILCNGYLSEVPLPLYSDQSSRLKLTDVKILDLSGNNIVSLPDTNFLFHLISVRKLCLSRNQLNSIPDEISAIKTMEILMIDDNNLIELPSQIKELDSLQILDLSTNKVTNVQDEICALGNLQALNLHSNQISSISKSIGNLSCLQSIDISSNKVTVLPDSLCALIHLIKLNLSNNYLSELPFQFGSLQNIEDLDISFNNIQKLPDSMSTLKKLTLLNVNQNKLIEIGDYISGFKSLVSYEGKNNNCTKLSKKLGSLSSINRLSLPMNQIENLPGELGLLEFLVHLDLHHNLIRELPVEIGALSRLQSLDLSNNLLSTLPHELCLMKSLVWLNISENNIDVLPEHFGSLYNLRILKLAHNKLKGVPKTFKELEAIQDLDMSSNLLHEIDIGLCEGLVSLKVANFESNRIRYLPRQICTMPSLATLNLKHNILSSLPLELTNCQIQIDTAQNPLDELPFKFHSTMKLNGLYQNPSGYTEEEVKGWMEREELFYKPAVDEWNIKMASYMTGKLGYDNFITGVIWRQENMYQGAVDASILKEDEIMIKRIKQFYFHCKKYGNPPLYTYRSEEDNKKREGDVIDLQQSREGRLQVARDIDQKRRAYEFQIYYGNLHDRCSNVDAQFRKVKDQKEALQRAETKALLDDVADRMIKKDKIYEEKKVLEKFVLTKETEILNALSFQSNRNKKRFLPIELDPCWKSNDYEDDK